MKALLISEVFPPRIGGSGKWLFEVYRRLAREAVIVAAGEHPEAAAFDEAQDLEIRRLPLAFGSWGLLDACGFRQYWTAIRRLVHLVQETQATEVHCGKVLPEGFLAWMLKLRFGLPYWVYVHGEELHYGKQSRQLKWMMHRAFRGAKGVIANSANSAAILYREWGLPRSKVHVVHPGVDAAHFCPADRDESFCERMGWSGRRVSLTVGRLQKRKGHDMLIRALPEISKHVPNVLFAIVGEGEERRHLESLAAATGVSSCVSFVGESNDEVLLRCYQQCDLFVLANREVDGDFEGFGMVLVEAQACGKAVIAGDSGGTRETMHVGETGLLVNCDGPELLAEAVSGLLLDQNRRERMGKAARRWVVEQFDWSRLAERAASILNLPVLASMDLEDEVSTTTQATRPAA